MSRFATSAKPSAALEPLLRHRLSMAAVMHLQWEARRFTRYDLAVRCLAAQALLRKSAGDEAILWYQQMQQRRAGVDSLESYRELVASVSVRGLDPDYPVGVTPRGELLDGAHRVAVALAVGAEDIAVDPRRSRRPRLYGREWFGSAGFSPEMVSTCDREIDRLMAVTGADGFLLSQMDPSARGHRIDPYLPSDTEVVSFAEITLSDASAKELEVSARYLPLPNKSSVSEGVPILQAGTWGVWRLRSHRPRYARLTKTASALSRSQERLLSSLQAAFGPNLFLLTLTPTQQRRVAKVLESLGWNHLEGVSWL